MPTCEKCWKRAFTRAMVRGTCQADEYAALLREKDEAGEICTPAEQRGDREEEA